MDGFLKAQSSDCLTPCLQALLTPGTTVQHSLGHSFKSPINCLWDVMTPLRDADIFGAVELFSVVYTIYVFY